MLLYGGGFILLYFGVLRPILQKLSIVKSPSDLLVDNVSNTANVTNPFSPAFYKTITAQASGALLIRVATAKDYAKRIYDAMGYFTDDEAAVVSVFRLLRTQSQVSFLSDVFQQTYGTDLIEFLKKGKGIMPEAGLNNDELSEIINIVNKLPKYKQ